MSISSFGISFFLLLNGTKDVFGLGEFHGFANIVRIKEECWDFLWGFI